MQSTFTNIDVKVSFRNLNVNFSFRILNVNLTFRLLIVRFHIISMWTPLNLGTDRLFKFHLEFARAAATHGTLNFITGDDDFGVFEVGMDKKGEIDNLTKIIKPDLGIITNISLSLIHI